jgi:hypothetical protein
VGIIHANVVARRKIIMFLKNILTEVGEDEPPSSDKVHRSPGDYNKHRLYSLCLRHLVGMPLHGRSVAIRYSLSSPCNITR